MRLVRIVVQRADLPVFEPDAIEGIDFGASQSSAATGIPQIVVEVAVLDVADGEVRHEDVAGAKLGAGCSGERRYRAAEDGELEAEAPACGGRGISGVVPPLGLEVGMGAMVAREAPIPGIDGAGESADVLGRRFDSRMGAERSAVRGFVQADAEDKRQPDQEQQSEDAPVHVFVSRLI